MANLTNTADIQKILGSSQEILVLTHENPNQDSLGASLALYLSLLAANKKTTIACFTPTTVEFTNLVGIDKVSQELGGKNFIISLDYAEGSIEKVSYNINGDKFNLVIEPKTGAPAMSPDKIHYSSSAALADLIFVLDSVKLQDLGKFYQDEQDLYTKANVFNIDYHQENSQFGTVNLLDSTASSTSELVTLFLQNLGLPLNEDMATNLLAGMDFATHNFSVGQASSKSFEAAAICLRAGGKRGKAAFVPTSVGDSGEPKEAPADWLQPKIFSSKANPPPQDITPKDGSTLL